ncbi:MAG: hypothetical protein JW870_18745 [Candidatus Delongbacteria bacterium]|nr:hypothetical protein [Candidatus Delongbacteria bacterium]
MIKWMVYLQDLSIIMRRLRAWKIIFIFGGNYGLSYFNPEEIIDNITPPNVRFFEVKLFISSKTTHDIFNPL